MKAVATALVLIAGAAVVLWYGNTLNSWVLGGLIGGLAALLLSIPISLTLFSYFSRRHDDQLKAEVEEEMALAQAYEPSPVPSRVVKGVYEVEGYMLSDEGQWEEEEVYNQRRPAQRNLPIPSSQRTPAVQRPANKLPVPYEPSMGRQPHDAPLDRGKEPSTRRPSARRVNYPGFPGYEPGSRGRLQTEALRAARQEASQQYDDVEVLPTYVPRRPTPARPLQGQSPRPSQHLPSQAPKHYRPRPTVESAPSHNGSDRALPARGQTSSRHATNDGDLNTDHLQNNNRYPQTTPIRQQPQTGQIVRNPQVEDPRHNPDVISGSLKNPLVRRAPYLYEDDPLKQQLAQQIGTPPVRRSSRQRQHSEEDQV